MKLVYVGMAADKIHPGHIYLLKEASKYGKIIVGILTDKAISSYKRLPLTTYEERKEIVECFDMVSKVVPQETLDYTDNLLKYKPNYVVHGDDWKSGPQRKTRQKAIKVMKKIGGEVIDIKLISSPSTTDIIEYEQKFGVTPDYRRKKLKRLLYNKPLLRILEAHNGLSGMIVNNTKVGNKEFDGIWVSSLTDSAAKGKPDIEIVDFTSRVNTINEILEVTTKPIIVDGDTGGAAEHFKYMINTLERLGVSAIIIEDKKFPKINSLQEGATHKQEDIDIFCNKIQNGVQHRITNEFMIIARIESIIAGKSVDDALVRATAYISAGADGIMIHSKNTKPHKLIEFCNRYKQLDSTVPLIVVPTTYNYMNESELKDLGANIVIYANHLLRSSHKVMTEVANSILLNSRSLEIDDRCTNVKDILGLIKK